ncbi:saccharopine dehydrogenase NADP-binding domain-containing protein [Microbispora sp. NPDC088329]|uniref:saccharopine dehydrogenase NADP-binding domain-containing protein n=1 Tax=Microbispora sp. NPDC088329 TaxID=3154869 RepID=UPI003442F206
MTTRRVITDGDRGEEHNMGGEVWILGGSGRSGQAIAAQLARRGVAPVLVGRHAERLAAAAARAGGARTVVAGSAEAMAGEIRRQGPAVVVNTVGPFTATAPTVTRACLAVGDYVDLANDVAAVTGVLGLHEAASAAGRRLVTGAGFGVTATESVVVKLCAGRPAPVRVRVDMVPSIAVAAGHIGEALAATLVEGIPGVEGGRRYGGRRYRDGRLAPAPIGGEPAHLVLPDGERVTTASLPSGELVAAQRASGAPDVVAASSEAPASPLMRVVLPAATALLASARIRDFARRRLARVQVKAHPQPRPHSWGHARLEWADGTVEEGWLRVGEAQEFTGAVPAEVVRRLLSGEGRPGAYTPAALFGPSLAEACGGTYLPVTTRTAP